MPRFLKDTDPNLYDYPAAKSVVSTIIIKIHYDGAMSVEGDILNKKYALAMLDTAKETIVGYHKRNESKLIVPAHDTALANKE